MGGEKETITVPISDLQGGEKYYLHLRADPQIPNGKGLEVAVVIRVEAC